MRSAKTLRIAFASRVQAVRTLSAHVPGGSSSGVRMPRSPSEGGGREFAVGGTFRIHGFALDELMARLRDVCFHQANNSKKGPQFLWGSDLLAETEGFEPSIRLLTV